MGSKCPVEGVSTAGIIVTTPCLPLVGIKGPVDDIASCLVNSVIVIFTTLIEKFSVLEFRPQSGNYIITSIYGSGG